MMTSAVRLPVSAELPHPAAVLRPLDQAGAINTPLSDLETKCTMC